MTSSLRKTYYQIAKPEPSLIRRLMTDDGTKDGAWDMSGDYSTQAKRFWVQPPLNEDWRLASFQVALSSTGTQNRADYGSLSNGLTNGLQFYIEVGGQEFLQHPVAKNNQELLAFTGGFNIFNFDGADDSIFSQVKLLEFSDGLILRGDRQTKFGVILNDDFTRGLTPITQHEIFCRLENLGFRDVTN